MVSTPEIFTENSLMSPGSYVTDKNPSARKSLCLFTEVFYVKNKTSVHRVGADKSNFKSIRASSMLWSSTPKRVVKTKINKRIKKSLYNCIIQHPQVMKSPIANNFLKVAIGSHSEPQVVPKLFLQVSVW